MNYKKKERRNNSIPDTLLLLEHPDVITLGKQTKDKDVIEQSIPIVKIDRGGRATYHGPGQIIGYPILDLDNFFTDIHKYLRFLEEAVILTLKENGLKSERSKGETGVWFDVGTPKARKICALGVKSSRWVTMHGFALNLDPEMEYYDSMIPCGIQEHGITSMCTLLSKDISMYEVIGRLSNNFIEIFKIMKDPDLHHKFVNTLDQIAPAADVYRKSGSWKNYHSDSALVWGPDRKYVIVALVDDANGEQIIRNLVKPLDRVLKKSRILIK